MPTVSDYITSKEDTFLKRRKNATPVPCPRGLPFKPRPIPIQYGRLPSRRAIKSPRLSGCQFLKRYVNQVETEEMMNSSQELSEYGSQVVSQEDSESTLISASQRLSQGDSTTQQFTIETGDRLSAVSAGRSSDYITCSTIGNSTDPGHSIPSESELYSPTMLQRIQEKDVELPQTAMPPLHTDLIECESIEIPRKVADGEVYLDISPIHSELADDSGKMSRKRRKQRDIEILSPEQMSPSPESYKTSSQARIDRRYSTKIVENLLETLPYPDISSVRNVDSVVIGSQQKLQETTPRKKISEEKCPRYVNCRRGHREAKKERLRRASTMLTSTVVDGRKSSPLPEILPFDVSISSVKSCTQTPNKDMLDSENFSQPEEPNKQRRVTSTPMKSRVKEGLLALMSLDVSSVHRDDSDLTLLPHDESREVNSQEIVAMSDEDFENEFLEWRKKMKPTDDNMMRSCSEEKDIKSRELRNQMKPTDEKSFNDNKTMSYGEGEDIKSEELRKQIKQIDESLKSHGGDKMTSLNEDKDEKKDVSINRKKSIGLRVKKAKEVLDTKISLNRNRRKSEADIPKKHLEVKGKKWRKQVKISPHDYPSCFLTDDSIDYPSCLNAKVMVCTRPRKCISDEALINRTPVDILELIG